MPAHLARHMSTTHGVKSASAKKKGAGRRGSVAAHSVAPNGLLDTLQEHYDALSAERESIEAQLDGIRTAMDALGAAVPAPSAGRSAGRRGSGGGRPGSLKDYIVRVLRGRSGSLSPREIAGAVKKAGYPTKSDDLTKAVSNMLPQIPAVRKVSRGQYSA